MESDVYLKICESRKRKEQSQERSQGTEGRAGRDSERVDDNTGVDSMNNSIHKHNHQLPERNPFGHYVRARRQRHHIGPHHHHGGGNPRREGAAGASAADPKAQHGKRHDLQRGVQCIAAAPQAVAQRGVGDYENGREVRERRERK